MNKKELIAQAQAKYAKTQELLNKGADITADDLQSVESLNTEIEGIKTQIERLDTAEGLKSRLAGNEAWMNAPSDRLPAPAAGNQPGMKNLGLIHAGETIFDADDNMLLSSGAGVFGQKTWEAINSTAYKQAYRTYLRKGDRGLGATEFKDLQEGLDPQGGYLAPPEMIMRIIQRQPTPTRVAGMVTNISTSRDAITMPKVNYAADDIYTTGFRVDWTGEMALDGEQAVNDANLFGSHRIEVFTAMLSGALTNDMVEDSAFPLEAWISAKFGETADLTYDNMVLNGSGVGQPTGMLANIGGQDQPVYVPTGVAGAISADSIFALAYSLPEQYDDNARFILNKTSTGKAIAQLKDGNDRYLFGMGTQDSGIASARPKELVGYPYAYSGFMPSVAANAYPVLFGDMSGYYKVNRIGLSIQVLRETRAKRNEIELVGRLRFGGKTVEPWKIKALKASVN